MYIHYKNLESSILAYNTMNGRYYAGKQVLHRLFFLLNQNRCGCISDLGVTFDAILILQNYGTHDLWLSFFLLISSGITSSDSVFSLRCFNSTRLTSFFFLPCD